MKDKDLSLIMISAMYENGGNTTHRILDGHPELMVYPFESQPGTKFVNDHLNSLFPLKYRWPVFPLGISAEDAYELIIDEEGKVRSKTPYVSKFRTADFQLADKERKKIFVSLVGKKPITTELLVDSFYRSTFMAWKNYKVTGKEKAYVGYSPIIGVDAEKIVRDFGKKGFVLHIIRNPWSAYADTKKRPVPLSIHHYMTGWVLCQQYMSMYQAKFPKNCFIVRYEDILADRKTALAGLFKAAGIKYSDTMKYPSWNAEKLTEVYPWGTIRTPTEEVNIATAKELSKAEIEEIHLRTKLYVDLFNYKDIYKKISK